MKDLVKCQYCGTELHRKHLKDHIGYEHQDKVNANKKSGKLVMIGAIIGLSAVIGMVILELFGG